jgi:hypothetical protein
LSASLLVIASRYGYTHARTRIAGPEALAQGSRLISSLDQELDADTGRLWVAEAERRLADLRSGRVAAIPAERVIKKVRAALR